MGAGRYHALRKIADGGTAEVFLAEQVGAAGFRRLVVLKRIRSSLYADDDFRRMLIEEAHLAMVLHHGNLVEVLDLGEAQGRYFMVLELVDGWTVEQLVRRARAAHVSLPPALAVYIAAEVCRGLAYAHERTRGGERLNIVHRDVCPNNVLVSEQAEVKLADFGIARARTRSRTTQVGMVVGKPAFMSPEQASGEELDHRSDLFSVGTLLYYLLTDELPFRAPSDRELLIRVASAQFVSPAKLKPSLPKELVKVVLKAMSGKAADRYASAQEMLSALERVQRSELEPWGHSELKAWLDTLSRKDGQQPLTRESITPAARAADEPEWIELTAEDLKSAQGKRYPVPAERRPWLTFIGAGIACLALLLTGWALVSKQPAPPATNVVTSLSVVPALPDAAIAQSAATQPSVAPIEPDASVASAQSADVELVADGDAGVEPVVATEAESVDEPESETSSASDAGAAAMAEAHRPTASPVPVAPATAATPATAAAVVTPTTPPTAAPRPTAIAAPAPPTTQSAAAALKVWGRLGTQKGPPPPPDRAVVQLETAPPGAAIMVEGKVLGHTPAALRFKLGVPFAITFALDGYPKRELWLTLQERPGKPPKVSLRPPP